MPQIGSKSAAKDPTSTPPPPENSDAIVFTAIPSVISGIWISSGADKLPSELPQSVLS